MQASNQDSPSARQIWLTKVSICLALAVGTLVIYSPVRHYQFLNYDDNDYITQNSHVVTGFACPNFAWAFTRFHSSNWHPLTWLSHMLDVQLWGLNPGGHHTTNVIFHVTNAVLLFLILASMTGARWRSAFVAAVFAWHPLHVESVAWISERKDVLSTLFWLLSMAAYLRYVRHPQARTYLLVVLCLALGLMSKPMLVTLPFTLLLLDYWPLQRAQLSSGEGRKWFRLVAEKLPLIALAAASGAVTFLAQRYGGALVPLNHLPFSLRLSNALTSYCLYLAKALWPVDLAVFYPMPGSIPAWQWIGSVLVLVTVTSMVVATAKQYPYLATGWFWFLGTLAPVIGIVQVGEQAMADRYMYVALIGLSMMIAWGLPRLLEGAIVPARRVRIALLAASAAVLMACAGLTARQLTYWHDSLSLFQHALAVTNDNWFAHGNVAISLGKQGKIREAIAHYRELLRIRPGSLEALNNLAWHLATDHEDRDRDGPQALALVQRALELSPAPDASTLDTLAAALAENRRFDEAAKRAEQARDLAISRKNPELARQIGERLELYKQGLAYRN
jgi:protein O-mannosyl-transferase